MCGPSSGTLCGAIPPPAIPLALSDPQLQTVMDAAKDLPVEKRTLLLQRVAARLCLDGTRFTDADVDNAVHVALRGLVQVSDFWGGAGHPAGGCPSAATAPAAWPK